MRLAILGSTSQIAKDLIARLVLEPQIDLNLFARNLPGLNEWLFHRGALSRLTAKSYADFDTAPRGSFDVVLNFVGSGNPALTASLGRDLWDITQSFDALALSYIKRDPACRYIFVSSGAIFGGDFLTPVDVNTAACLQPNNVRGDAWYGLAKLNAEISHRRFGDLPIVDVRVFNYFSRTADPKARFLITDILRSIQESRIFETSSSNIVRDYLGPNDFYLMVNAIISSEPTNVAVDCYTKSPVEKLEMLKIFEADFGLKYRLVDSITGLNATGSKTNYYSINHRAGDIFGYVPALSSLETLVQESREILGR